MNLRDLLVGAAFGALIASGIEFAHYKFERYSKPKPAVSAPVASSAPLPVPLIPAQPKSHDAQAAWLGRREIEFDRCATLHGTPTLGFGMRVVCLDSHAVKFLGEEHPPDE